MSAPHAEPVPSRVAASTTDAQAALVRRYARMLRLASASAPARRGGPRALKQEAGRTGPHADSATAPPS
jgi:hypothetical protein